MPEGNVLQSTVSNTGSNPRPGVNATLDSTDAAVTWTAAQVLGGLIRRSTAGARSDVTPTAALLIAEMKRRGLPTDIGTNFDVIVTQEGGMTLTVTAGVGVTLVPTTITIATLKNLILNFRITSTTTVLVIATPATA